MANPTLLTTPFANSGDKNTIPATSSTAEVVSQASGWGANYSVPLASGGFAPKRIDMNGVFNLLSNILFYCQKGYTFEYDSTQAYYTGCIVRDTDLYYCTSSVNSGATGHRPSTDTNNLHWKKLALMFDNTPVGVVQAWAGDDNATNGGVPTNWLICRGQELSTTDYPELFAVIKYKYGGEGTKFNLPNLVSKFIEGTDGNSGDSVAAGLPNITGTFAADDSARAGHYGEKPTGCFYDGGTVNLDLDSDSGNGVRMTLDASRSSSVYGNSATVQPAAVYMRYIIKYKKG